MAGQKILVVDDEARMRKLVTDFLTKDGFEVLEAGDGEAAMDLFYSSKDIALVILDVMMPKMDGWQVLREIRESSQVPVIMLTARTDERDELRGFDLGVDEYVTKPFSPLLRRCQNDRHACQKVKEQTGRERRADQDDLGNGIQTGGIRLYIGAYIGVYSNDCEQKAPAKILNTDPIHAHFLLSDAGCFQCVLDHQQHFSREVLYQRKEDRPDGHVQNSE